VAGAGSGEPPASTTGGVPAAEAVSSVSLGPAGATATGSTSGRVTPIEAGGGSKLHVERSVSSGAEHVNPFSRRRSDGMLLSP